MNEIEDSRIKRVKSISAKIQPNLLNQKTKLTETSHITYFLNTQNGSQVPKKTPKIQRSSSTVSHIVKAKNGLNFDEITRLKRSATTLSKNTGKSSSVEPLATRCTQLKIQSDSTKINSKISSKRPVWR